MAVVDDVLDWQDEYFNWLMTPRGQRVPATKSEFAEQFKVGRMTLWRLEQKPEFQARLTAARGRLAVEHYGTVIGVLLDVMENSERDAARVSAARVLLDHLELPRNVQAMSEDLTPEELERLVAALGG